MVANGLELHEPRGKHIRHNALHLNATLYAFVDLGPVLGSLLDGCLVGLLAERATDARVNYFLRLDRGLRQMLNTRILTRKAIRLASRCVVAWLYFTRPNRTS